jgi:hypothetical protein
MEHLIATWAPLAAQRRERARIRSEKGIRVRHEVTPHKWTTYERKEVIM